MDKLKSILEEIRPEKWENIPDIDLYMDQVLNYMTRQHVGLELDETLTAAMINNYMKKDLLPRANGKKYDRQHIAYLTAICLLKQVLSVTETGQLLSEQIEQRTEENVKEFYEKYTVMMDEEFCSVSKQVNEIFKDESLADLALRLAISSYAQKLACQEILKKIEQRERNNEQIK